MAMRISVQVSSLTSQNRDLCRIEITKDISAPLACDENCCVLLTGGGSGYAPPTTARSGRARCGRTPCRRCDQRQHRVAYRRCAVQPVLAASRGAARVRPGGRRGGGRLPPGLARNRLPCVSGSLDRPSVPRAASFKSRVTRRRAGRRGLYGSRSMSSASADAPALGGWLQPAQFSGRR